MKKLISFVITLFCCVQARAANPSFQSFYTNDFIVVQPYIYARHTNDGGTNIFNDFVIINTNTVIVNTQTVVTNNFTTIFNSITTNHTENSTIINTNVLISNTFITNIVDNSVIIITNTSVTIDGTNVATINPTIGRIPYKSGTNSFDDSALYFIDPSTVGADEVDAATVGVTNLVAGGIVISVDSGFGYGYLTNMAFADTLLWTNVGGSGGSYQPTQPQGSLVARGIESYDHLTARGSFITQLSAFELLVAGENDEDVSGKSYFAVVGADSIATNSWLRINSGNGVGQHLFIVNSADNSAFYMLNGDLTWDNPALYLALRGGDWVSTNRGDTIQLLGTFNGWAEVGRFWANTNSVVSELTINPTDGYLPYRSNSVTFGNSPWYRINTNQVGFNTTNSFLIATASSIYAGTGGTNITSGAFNTVFGKLSGTLLSSGVNNSLLGFNSGNGLTSGSRNTAIGSDALVGIATNINNTAVGVFAGQHIVGDYNTIVGYAAASGNTATNAIYNNGTFLGALAGNGRTNGSNSVLIGYSSGYITTSKNTNNTRSVLIGANAGQRITNLIDSVMIGESAATNLLAELTNSIVIGTRTQVTNSNEIIIGNTDNTAAYLPSMLGLGLGNANTSQISFGPNGTNVLYRSGSDLVYTNGSSDTKLNVYNGSGGGAALESQALTAFLSASGSSTAAGIRAGSDQALLFSGAWYPVVDSTESLGSDFYRWKSLNLSSNAVVQGYNDLVTGTNYSRLSLYHTGTNGAIVFDSQSAGTAGSPKDFWFSHSNVVDMVVAPNLAYVQKDSIASVDPISVYGLKAVNGTSATSGQQQNSPAVSWSSQGWSTNLNATESVTFGAHGSPVAGNAHPLGQLKFNYKIGVSGDSGTQGTAFTVDTRGPVKIASVTKAQKTAILAPEDGMMVYQTDNTPGLRAYVNGAWVMVSTAADP